MTERFSTALIGFGKIAQGYANDIKMKQFYPYATHAQVLRDHPSFDWQFVVDPDASACSCARHEWKIPTAVSSLDDLGTAARADIEVIVMATPPEYRLEMLDRFPNLRAVLVEKPLGVDLVSSQRFISECDRRGILVQVNLWRRADEGLINLADAELSRLVGKAQTVFGVYGNGLVNNGTHMVDMVRMLFGEIDHVQRITSIKSFQEGPIREDTNPAFALKTERDVAVLMSPLRFSHYRENGLCICGEIGRLDILNEGLSILHYKRSENRAMSGADEIVADDPTILESTVGHALYRMYNNLAETLGGKSKLWSSGDSGLRSTQIVEAILASPETGQSCAV